MQGTAEALTGAKIREELRPFRVIHGLGNAAIGLDAQIHDLNRIKALNGEGNWGDTIDESVVSLQRRIEILHGAMLAVGVRGWTAPDGSVLKVHTLRRDERDLIMQTRPNSETAWQNLQLGGRHDQGSLERGLFRTHFVAKHLMFDDTVYKLWALDEPFLARVQLVPNVHFEVK